MQAFTAHGPVLANSMFSEIRGQACTYLRSLDKIHQIVGTAWGSLGKAAGMLSILRAMGKFLGSLLVLFPNSYGLQASTCPCGDSLCLRLRLQSLGRPCANEATSQ